MRFQQAPGLNALPLGRIDDAICHEGSQRFFVCMLQLAPAARAKVLARSLNPVGSGLDITVTGYLIARHSAFHVPPVLRHPVALGSEASDQFRCAHRHAARALLT